MNWDTEDKLVEEFIGLVNKLKNKRNKPFKVLREVQTGYGRPDIAVIEYNPKIVESRIKSGKSTLCERISTKSAYAMSYLTCRRWVKKETLSEFLKCKGNTFNKVIQELEKRALIDVKGNLIKAKPRQEILAINRLLSYEAKLHQWKDAVDQAERNLWFTNESYVLMPAKSNQVFNTLSEECNKRGVGLGLFEGSQCYKEIVKPANTGIINSPLLWILNEQILEEHDERKEL